jgi:hypothetical protein
VLREILSNRKLVTYLVINIIISAATTLIVIALWMQFTVNDKPAFISTNSQFSAIDSQLRITAIIGAGDVDTERVTIEHVGDEDLSLSGWKLSDSGSAEYRFPALVLHPGAQVTIHTRSGDDTASDLYWDRQISVWTTGEAARLLDASGQPQATYTVP